MKTIKPAINTMVVLLCTVLLGADRVAPQKVSKAHDDLAKLIEKNGGKVCD